MKSSGYLRKFIVVAPFCGEKSSKWFSSGRHRKLSQLFNVLTSLDFQFDLFSTCPIGCQSYLGQPLTRCCSSGKLYLRYAQLFLYGVFVGSKFLFCIKEDINIWLYNSRSPEFIFLIPIKLLNFRNTSVFIQFEDLPFARKQNFGIRGFLDSISTFFLLMMCSSCSVVSKSMELTLVHRYFINPKSIIVFPPLADDLYLSALSSRLQPFSSNVVNVMYAGGYSKEKGISTLLNAFRKLPEQNFTLHLYGPVPTSLSEKLSKTPNIVIHGLVDELYLFKSYANSDVLVNAHDVISTEALIFPFKTIEILLSGSLPLLTPMPGLENFDIPSDCFFNDSSELFCKLMNSKQIFKNNTTKINELATSLRSSSDPTLFSNKLKQFLSLNFFSK